MVKRESSTPGVYLVGVAGKERPWCGKCHKFLKSETAPHDCTPAHFSRGSGGSSGGRKRRIRLTPKTVASLETVFGYAAKEAVVESHLKKLAGAKSSKQILSAAKSLIRGLSKSKSRADKKYNSYVKKYLGK